MTPTNDPATGATAVRSWGRVLLGVAIAIALPVAYRILAALVESGFAPYDQVHALLNLLFAIAFVELALGPMGIIIAGTAAGVRGAGAWILLLVVALPVLFFAWAVAVLTLTGSLGEPF
jgi:hypothetical protein